MGKQKGQALVEMAIITPFLIFILIGVFEVGWALRGYLILINANREVARYAVRPEYLNFETTPRWDRVKAQYLSAATGISLDLDERDTLILAYVEVFSGVYTDTSKDCFDNYNPVIVVPANNPTHTVIYGPLRISHFDYYQIGRELADFNREQICRGALSRVDGLIIAESWYEQPQLFGFPLISNPLTDPVPMYAHTVMRKITGLRGSGKE